MRKPLLDKEKYDDFLFSLVLLTFSCAFFGYVLYGLAVQESYGWFTVFYIFTLAFFSFALHHTHKKE